MAPKLGFDQHSLVADPLFVDPAKGDYRLRPDSPAFKLGFKRIPVERIGPHADPLRASWPIVEAPGMREAMARRAKVGHLQGEMTGEVTTTSAILQSRLTGPELDAGGDVPGVAGVARFEVAEDRAFGGSTLTPWLEARPESDHVVKTKVDGLKPGTRYFYRLLFGPDRQSISRGPARSFRTLPGGESVARTSFVVVTGMNYSFFHHGRGGKGKGAYQGPDKQLGYPALVAIKRLAPDFFVGTGDNVYYDHPRQTAARTPRELRKKWHEQFVQPRYVDLFATLPTYWEKDDHDHRYNDSDTSGDREPSNELGIRVFKEQVPVTDPADPKAVTYRTHRVSKLLQIWLVEGRDYRDPNKMPDGPDKTLWGKTQLDWLKRTLLESDAPLKLLISPTPLVGPDDISKRDNHCDPGGFRHEGDAFFAWAKQQGLLDKGLFLVCGDRHWQYHAIHPSGFEEFSCGALVDANSRMGVPPGSKRGTDPDARIKQPYSSREPSGGFLNVVIEPAAKDQPVTARFNFYDENGKPLYSVEKRM